MAGALAKITARAALLLGVVLLVYALAMLAMHPAGITFAQGAFTLTIDSTATYNGAPQPALSWDLKNLVPGVDKFFNFADIKPGDSGENTISLHTNEDAWICLAFSNLTQAENGENEPEGLVDNTQGADLAAGTEVFAWRDDGDNIFEPQSGEGVLFGVGSAAALLNNTIYTIADALTPPPVAANTTSYFGITWCAGDLTVNLATGAISCSGAALGNIAQTDSFSVDMSIQAAAAAGQPNFRCALGGEPPPPPPPPNNNPGLGETIGLFVKCQTIATFGWPLPKYQTECPGGFNKQSPSSISSPPPPLQTSPPAGGRGTTRTR